MWIEVDSLTCLLRRKHLNLFILHGLQQTLQEWCRRQTPCRNSDVPWPRAERNVVSRLSRLEVELRSASHVLEEGRIGRLDQINLVSLQILVILQCDKETGIIDVCTNTARQRESKLGRTLDCNFQLYHGQCHLLFAPLDCSHQIHGETRDRVNI